MELNKLPSSLLITSHTHAQDHPVSLKPAGALMPAGDAVLVNYRIFDEDIEVVIGRIIAQEHRICETWDGRRSNPQEDLTWLCLGFNITAHEFVGHPNYFQFDDMGATFIIAARAARDTMSLLHDSLLQAALHMRTTTMYEGPRDDHRWQVSSGALAGAPSHGGWMFPYRPRYRQPSS